MNFADLVGASDPDKQTPPPAQAASQDEGFGPAPADDLDELIGTATPGDSNPYFIEGTYPVVELVTIYRKRGGQRDNHRRVIAEFRVLESNVPMRPVGTIVGWVRDIDGSRYPQSTAAEIRALLAAAAGVSMQEITPARMKIILPDSKENRESPLVGRCVAVEGDQKGDPRNFCKTQFTSLPGSDEDHANVVAELCRRNDLTPF